MLENDLIFTQKEGVRVIKLNRPGKKNALNKNMYETIARVLNEDAENDKISITILTGVGEYFTSGNDVIDAMKFNGTGGEIRLQIVKNMINAFINYPKLLIAVVNGPAIGIGATILALCDVVYASDKATFGTPFVKLGLCAEAASSYTFPRIMGRSKAFEMLLLGHTITAQEAYDFNLISQIVPHAQLSTFIQKLQVYGKLSPNAIRWNKVLINKHLQKTLLQANNTEIDLLVECVESKEFSDAISNFLSRKSKL